MCLGAPTKSTRHSLTHALKQQYIQVYKAKAETELRTWFAEIEQGEPQKGYTFTDSTPQEVKDILKPLHKEGPLSLESIEASQVLTWVPEQLSETEELLIAQDMIKSWNTHIRAYKAS